MPEVAASLRSPPGPPGPPVRATAAPREEPALGGSPDVEVGAPDAVLDAPRGESLLHSIGANVAGQAVFVLSGFIVPRLINDRIGVTMLGVWDFGWSMVAHLMLVSGGMLSAVSRDVARFPATRDVGALRSLASSCAALFGALALVVLGLTGVTAFGLPWFLTSLPAEALYESQLALWLLGAGTAARFVFHVFNGVITGYQRFVLHNAIQSGSYLAGVVFGVVGVLLGGGLAWMAGGYLAGEVLAGLLKARYARRICPELRIDPRDVRLATLRHVFNFGGKTMLGAISRTMLYQTNALLVARFLGVEAIALFARCRSLVMLLDTLVQRVVAVFAPRASEADARDDRAGVRELFHQAAETSNFVVLPGVAALLILGGPILHAWMGDSFSNVNVLALLAIGHLPMLAQRGTYYVLIGLHRHGLPAAFELLASLVAITLSYLMLAQWRLGLTGAALAIILPLAISNWLVLPLYVSRLLGISLSDMAVRAFRRPLIAVAPAVVVFGLFALLELPSDALRVLLALLIGGGLYLVIVARLMLTREQFSALRSMIGLRRGGEEGACDPS